MINKTPISHAEIAKRIALAADGKYRCQICSAEKPQAEGVVVGWAGAPLLTVCPACVPGTIIIQRHDSGGISIQMAGRADQNRRVLLPHELPRNSKAVFAQPEVQAIKLR